MKKNYAVFSLDGKLIEYFENGKEMLEKYSKIGQKKYDNAKHKAMIINPNHSEYYCWLIPGSPRYFEIVKNVSIKQFGVNPETAVWIIVWDTIMGQGIRLYKKEEDAMAFIERLKSNPSIIPESISIDLQNIH